MKIEEFHLLDDRLLLDIDGELSTSAAKQVQAHLAACWRCRARRQELEHAIASFVRTHQQTLDAHLPSSAGPRALLKARLENLPATQPNPPAHWLGIFRKVSWSGVGLLLVFFLLRSAPSSPEPVVSIPNPKLTPGAAIFANKQDVCAAANVKNKVVPVSVRRKVFAEYGIGNAGSDGYEVDYLVTPALGGSDDIRNLWPHSYSAAWNAHVKDMLEDQLRTMVCDGNLDLTEAQQEIAANWINAYKKYFHTNVPLAQ